ncbi:MAG: bifunctional folylpolyglutamate synthase/dihydrofolate synthase [Firmicutes bacterium]|nr:bifunctional folylpolyglutamate synthase/dihydrofolate synthase [Bacillota bacterium]MCL5039428.1 bifunctional folylpolyglutamate synthase/dihydrofolate synthase [Bacillota bacterium]
MNYREALDYLDSFYRFGGQLGLERLRRILFLLGDPQQDLKVIHVAGTNGKGSVTAMVARVLEMAGYRVGRYTSPHLEDFTERISINGRDIPRERVAELVALVRPAVEKAIDEGYTPPTEFEVITALAFLYYQQEGVDFISLEVGLGGTYDATNVIPPPLVAVITSIGLDHTERLGETKEEIAREKAGIIKAGSQVVTSAQEPEVLKVIVNRAGQAGCPLWLAVPQDLVAPAPAGEVRRRLLPEAGPDSPDEQADRPAGGFSGNLSHASTIAAGLVRESAVAGAGSLTGVVSWTARESTLSGQVIDLTGPFGKLAGVKLSLVGTHQQQNAATAAAAIGALGAQGFPIKEEDLRRGLATTTWPGRLEVIQQRPLLILDGAHNPDGARVLRRAIKEILPPGRIILITGMVTGKASTEVFSALLPLAHLVIVTRAETTRAADPGVLAAEARPLAREVLTIPRPEAALDQALALAREDDIILVAGSLYLVGDIRGVLRRRGLLDDQAAFGSAREE